MYALNGLNVMLVACQRSKGQLKSNQSPSQESNLRPPYEARAVRAWELTPTPILRITPGLREFGKSKKNYCFAVYFALVNDVYIKQGALENRAGVLTLET